MVDKKNYFVKKIRAMNVLYFRNGCDERIERYVD